MFGMMRAIIISVDTPALALQIGVDMGVQCIDIGLAVQTARHTRLVRRDDDEIARCIKVLDRLHRAGYPLPILPKMKIIFFDVERAVAVDEDCGGRHDLSTDSKR